MGPPKGATKAKAHPRKKRIPSVEEVAPKKKKPLFLPHFQLLKDPDSLVYLLMADELDSLLPILQTLLISTLFQASALFLLYLWALFRFPPCARTVLAADSWFARLKARASNVRSASEAGKVITRSSSLLRSAT